MDHQVLDQALVERLCVYPMSTFVPLGYNGTKVTNVGMLTLEETDAHLSVNKNTVLTLRPDKLPDEALSLSMLSLTPLCVGALNVGWFITFPALNVALGRNYVRVIRGRSQVSEKDQPQLSVYLRSLIVMEVPDIMSMVLSTAVKDMRT